MAAIKKAIDKAVEWICIFLLGFMTILVTYQVVTRYFFNAPSAISEVLAKYLFVWLVMICGAYVFGLREHMNIAFLRDKLPLRTRLTVEIFSEVLIVLFALTVMIVGGYRGALKQMIQLDSALQIPVGIIYAVIPISGVLIVFYFIYNVSRLAKQFAAGDGSKEGA